MDDIEVELLWDLINRLSTELEDGAKYFMLKPYSYSDEIIEEVISIWDRLETLQAKLRNEDFTGSFRYETPGN